MKHRMHVVRERANGITSTATIRWHCLVFTLFAFASSCLVAKPIMDLDEIWNYNFARNIYDGLAAYKDFNMVQTPLAAYLAAMFLMMFGNSLLAFRILGALLCICVFFLLYCIANSIMEYPALAWVCTVFLFALCYLVWIYNYNNLNLLVILLIIWAELNLEKGRFKNRGIANALIGLLFGLSPIIKQSTGVFLFGYHFIYSLTLLIRKKEEKTEAALRLILSFVPMSIFTVGLLLAGHFNYFLDYAVKGVRMFTHRVSWFDYIRTSPIDLVVGIFPGIVTICSIIVIIRHKSRISTCFHLKILLISWAGASVAYPLCDYVHICIAIVPFLVCLFCCVPKWKSSSTDSLICAIVATLILACSACMTLKDAKSCKACELDYFSGLPINAELEQQIIIVDSYITQLADTGTEVIIADDSAAAYTIPAGKYYKDFDLLLVGNLGTKTVEELLWRTDAVYLVVRDEAMLGMQSHRQLVEYIKEYYVKVGEVLGFDAYMPR